MGEFFDREPHFQSDKPKNGMARTFILDVDLSIRGECQSWARAFREPYPMRKVQSRVYIPDSAAGEIIMA
jgi:hypothetical protein